MVLRPVILGLKRLRQEDIHKFKASLGYLVRSCFKVNKQQPLKKMIQEYREESG